MLPGSLMTALQGLLSSIVLFLAMVDYSWVQNNWGQLFYNWPPCSCSRTRPLTIAETGRENHFSLATVFLFAYSLVNKCRNGSRKPFKRFSDPLRTVPPALVHSKAVLMKSSMVERWLS